MRRSPRRRLVAGILALAGALMALGCTHGCPGPPATTDRAKTLDHRFRQLIAETLTGHAGGTVAVAYRCPERSEGFQVLGDRDFHAASTMKVPVLLEAWCRAADGSLDLDETVPIKNRFASVVDGSPYSLTPADDSDPSLYERIGGHATIRELARLMIVRSSNLATNLLVDRLGADAIQRTVDRLEAGGVLVRRGVEDQKAFDAGISNRATANGLAVLFEALAAGERAGIVDAESMLAILEAQEFNELIPAGLPPDAHARVAHKTGSITRVQHDAALVRPEREPAFVLVVLTAGFATEAASAAAIRAVTAAVWRFHCEPR